MARTRRAGFTLIEMLFVLSLLLAVSVVVVPRLLEWFHDWEIQFAADEVVLAVGKTRASAATTGLPHHLEYQVGGSSYRVTSDAGVDLSSRWQTLTGGAVFTSWDPGEQQVRDSWRVTFDAEGRTAAEQIRIANGRREFLISINPFTGIASKNEMVP